MSRHLSKLFDSLCKLKFRLDASGKPLKFGLGMYSKEDEYVDFDQECDLSGQVRATTGTRRELPLGWRRPVAGTARPQRGCQQQPVASPLSSSLGLAEQMLKGRLSRSPCTALPMQSEVTCEKKERRNEEGEGRERTDLLMPLNLCCSIIINAKGTTLEGAMHTCQGLIPVQHDGLYSFHI